MVIGVLIEVWIQHRRERHIERPHGEPERAPLPADHRIGSFLAGQLLRDGGTASVYLGSDASGHAVAIKIPHADLLADRPFVEGFRREASVGLELHHPSIVRVLEVGAYSAETVHNIPFFAMEFLEGVDLRTALRQEGRLEPAMASQITRGVADALEWAHRRGVVHRDVSPQNIFLTRNKMAKVMDFGISAMSKGGRRQAQGVPLGTPEYMAPERIHAPSSADPRSDLYALGCVFFEMLTGHPPYQNEDVVELLQLHCKAPIPRPSKEVVVSSQLEEIVMRLLEKDAAKRYQTAREVTTALADLRSAV